MDDSHPDPLGALRSAAEDCGIDLPAGLLEQILELEAEPAEQEAARSVVQARLRTLIETSTKD